MYDTNWYLGRLINFTNQEQTFCTIKFLKSDLDTFYWPKHPEQQEVDIKYIFYGPINLQGFGPFTIKRNDRHQIIKIYKSLKKNVM